MKDEDLGWYQRGPDGEPLCPTCGEGAKSVAIVGQGEVGMGAERSVISQAYEFRPCGHRAEFGEFVSD